MSANGTGMLAAWCAHYGGSAQRWGLRSWGRGVRVKGTTVEMRPLCECTTGFNSDQEAIHMLITIIIC